MSPRPPILSRRLLPWLASVALAAVIVTPHAHAQRAPVDPDTVLATLKDLKARQTQIVSKEKQNVLALIQAAQADPAKAYEQATLAVDFQGQGNNDSIKIMEWRKKQGELLRNPAFVTGLRLQLAYISLTWQRSMGYKNKALLPALYEYTGQVMANLDSLWSYEPLKRPLGQIVFVRYFQIAPYIASIEDWSDQPFDVDSIYDKSILPTLREMKDPRLLDYWAGKIQGEASRVDSKGTNALAVNKFNNVRRPALLWSRAEDELIIGQRDAALADMLAIAKAHPDHPDFDKWVQQLTDLVSPAKGEIIVRDGPASNAPAGTAGSGTPAPGSIVPVGR